MFTNSVLFHAGRISVTLVEVFGAAAVLLAVLAAVIFIVLFKRTHGVVERMSPDEAARLAAFGPSQFWDSTREPVYARAVGAVGRSVEIHFDIDSLRNAHRNGDLLTFWLPPILVTCWAGAFWMIFMAFFVAADVPLALQIMGTVCLSLFAMIPWFMVWAAVYTNIDLGKAGDGSARAGETTPGATPLAQGPTRGQPRR